ncbi:serine hydrolase [Aquimarina sp. 2201CG5-10]|uniref:serine hydrolase n=1 Tax=Aquimarina callyspongiae TaxID=3098150 RepID=UPI002AB58E66|nr:serine hydrolase [Aquimarina sp. 2201CG5-10]MDY8137295.1 serine hydrolase [Aquimarina sp. 2201CG5-10]
MKNSIFLLIPLLFLNCKKVNREQEPNKVENPKISALETLILDQKTSFNVPGMAVGVIKEGEIFYANGVGVKDLESKDALTQKSIFHMASVSKPFVATAIIQLVEQNKIELDKKLTDYLPYFKMKDDRYKEITIRQILNHSSGIPDVQDYEWDNPQYDEGAAERYVKSFDVKELDFTPGEKYNYSNASFNILADVIAKVSGMTFEDYMQKNIFEPIGMINSTFYKPDVPEELATKPHVLGDQLKIITGDFYPYNRIHAPSSTLHSNVDDMLLWAQLNLNKGTINGKTIYNKDSYKLLTTGQVKVGKKDSVCLSWFTGHLEGFKMFRHSGGDEGYRTFFGFIPEKKSAIVLMANNDFLWSENAANHLLRNILLEENKPWKTPIHFVLKDYILNEGIEKCKQVYFEKQTKTPEKYILDSWCIDELGYWLLDRGYNKKALEVFQFNLELEPNYAGWIDSVGDAYRAMDEKEKAIHWYKKALKVKPDQEFSRKKLNELIKNK